MRSSTGRTSSRSGCGCFFTGLHPLVSPFGFEGRYIDMPIAFVLGCIVGALQLVAAPSNELYANVFEISAAVLTSFLSRLFPDRSGAELYSLPIFGSVVDRVDLAGIYGSLQ